MSEPSHVLILPPSADHWVVACNAHIAIAQSSAIRDERIYPPSPLYMRTLPEGDWEPMASIPPSESIIKVAIVHANTETWHSVFYLTTDGNAQCIEIDLLHRKVLVRAPIYIDIGTIVAKASVSGGIYKAYVAAICHNTCIISIDDGVVFRLLEFRVAGWMATPDARLRVHRVLNDIPHGAVMSTAAASYIPDVYTVVFVYQSSLTSYRIMYRNFKYTDGRVEETADGLIPPADLELPVDNEEMQPAKNPVMRVHLLKHAAYKEPVVFLFYHGCVLEYTASRGFLVGAWIPQPICMCTDDTDPDVVYIIDTTGIITPLAIESRDRPPETNTFKTRAKAAYKHVGVYTIYSCMTGHALHYRKNQFVLLPSAEHIAIFDDTYFNPETPDVDAIRFRSRGDEHTKAAGTSEHVDK